MALVITLILLSVTLVMAVAFLAISRRERNAVTTTTDTASARLAAEAALANAEAQIVANIFATANVAACNFGLLVSTNYINGYGFTPNSANPTNVNYYYPNGAPLSANDLIQNIANLFYLPRVPVYTTNLVFHTNENRFYLDLNRNGRDEPNGAVPMIGPNGGYLHQDGTEGSSPVNVVTNFEVGDPEWIGELDHPDAPHGPNNRFVSRYAFIAVPAGNTLDINAIHNQAYDAVANRSLTPPNDEFFRNEGVGSWELNLAAFLADLNTNEWGQIVGSGPNAPVGSDNYYQYNEPSGIDNGRAFHDALSLLAYRYNYNYNSLASTFSLYGPNGYSALTLGSIDGYTFGQLMTNTQLPVVNFVSTTTPWSGADNTNQFYTLQEFFDPAKTEMNVTPPGFVERLQQAGTNVSTYDRYTYYRMLDQLGSDSAPESDKINLNYANTANQYAFNSTVIPGYWYPTNMAIIPGAETNFVPWAATNFFMAAADRLLRLYTTNWFQANPSNYLFSFYGITNDTSCLNNYGYFTNYPNGLGLTNIPLFGMTNQVPAFGITNIPVFVNGQFVYSPAVNRLLQLTANIYDSVYYSSNYVVPAGSSPGVYLPTVLRPIFSVTMTPAATNVYICSFAEVRDTSFLANPILNLRFGPSVINTLALQPNDLVFGVPLIIGAKKGFPNFNELYMESAFQLTRKVEVTRKSPSSTITANPNDFNYYQMFNLGLTNQFGVECWNSYRSNYTRVTDIYMYDYLSMTLTNDENNFSYTANLVFSGSIQTNNWQGYNPRVYPFLVQASFLTNSLTTNFAAVPVSMYRFNGSSPFLTTNLNLGYETNVPTINGANIALPQPHWFVTLTNNLQVIMVDDSSGRLIDYVQLNGPNSVRDLSSEIQNEYDTARLGNNTGYNDQWDPTFNNQGMPAGITYQQSVSEGNGTPPYSAKLWGRDQKTVYDQFNGLIVFLNGPNAMLKTYSGYTFDPTLEGIAETTNAMQFAYTPTALVVQDIDWQVNDPLVHYMASDLVNPASSVFTGSPFNWYNNYTYADNFSTESGFGQVLNWPGNLGALNKRYQPWGGGVGTNMLSIKDPLVYGSDDWNFPTNKLPTVGWLGRVHRGTPWQTVYLKSSDVLSYTNYFGPYGNNGPNLWVDWTGNVNPFDVTNTAPKKDWLLFDLFTTAFNDNATRGQLSVNVAADNPDPAASLAAWSALFSGVIALSNNAPDAVVLTAGQSASSMTNFTAFPISPAGPVTNSALWQIVQGIYNTRTNFTNPDGVKGAFEHAGYILSVPQLTVRSPFLNWNDSVQQQNGISDEMYEWLPQQVMSLLHEGPPRYVIYCYGQALKPAPNSLVTSGSYFQMCTNYQVVAESTARAVVRVEGAGTPTPHIVVESYNPLPPD
jgi:hypothetical protein